MIIIRLGPPLTLGELEQTTPWGYGWGVNAASITRRSLARSQSSYGDASSTKLRGRARCTRAELKVPPSIKILKHSHGPVSLKIFREPRLLWGPRVYSNLVGAVDLH